MFEHKFEQLNNFHIFVSTDAKRTRRHPGVSLEVNMLWRHSQASPFSNEVLLLQVVGAHMAARANFPSAKAHVLRGLCVFGSAVAVIGEFLRRIELEQKVLTRRVLSVWHAFRAELRAGLLYNLTFDDDVAAGDAVDGVVVQRNGEFALLKRCSILQGPPVDDKV